MLLLICSLSHRNRKEERETDGKAGEWRAKGHNAFCSLPPPPHPLSLRLPPRLCLLSSRPRSARERRLTISLTILYTSGGEQWRPTTKNSGNRGTAFFSFGWLLHAGPIDTHRPAETDRCQRERERRGERERLEAAK